MSYTINTTCKQTRYYITTRTLKFACNLKARRKDGKIGSSRGGKQVLVCIITTKVYDRVQAHTCMGEHERKKGHWANVISLIKKFYIDWEIPQHDILVQFMNY